MRRPDITCWPDNLATPTRLIADIDTALTITALGRGGDGLADIAAVPFALPGERIEGGRIVQSSAARQTPPCPHFTTCGGCRMQHANDAFLSAWKVEIVENALRAHGIDAAVTHRHTSPPGTRQRVAFSGRRTKKTVQIGFFAHRSNDLVPIDACDLLAPDIAAGLDMLRGIVRLAASRSSVVRLTVTASQAGLDVLVEDARPLTAEMLPQLAEVAATSARLTWNGDVVLLRAAPIHRFGKAEVIPPPGAFLQATPDGAQALISAVLVEVDGASAIVDLFAGCGTFTLPLAETAEVHAVEGDAAMLAAADQGWRQATGLRRVTTEARDLFRRPLLASELNRFDAITIDPPRAGAAAQIAEIAKSVVPVVVHVSCNPASFARDAATLVAAGYQLGTVAVVDQFRWSTHVELVATFRRTDNARQSSPLR